MKRTNLHVFSWVLAATLTSVIAGEVGTAAGAGAPTSARGTHEARLPAPLYDAGAAAHDAMVGYPAVMIMDMEIGPTECKINGAVRPNAPATKPTRFDVLLVPKGDRES